MVVLVSLSKLQVMNQPWFKVAECQAGSGGAAEGEGTWWEPCLGKDHQLVVAARQSHQLAAVLRTGGAEGRGRLAERSAASSSLQG